MPNEDIVTRLQAHRDIDNDRCCECGHWTAHDDDCMIGEAADEIERLRHQVDDLRRCLEDTQFQIERRRAAGDALAQALNEHADLYADEYDLIDAWNEARS